MSSWLVCVTSPCAWGTQAAVEWAAHAGALPPAGRAAAADALALQAANHTEAVAAWGRGAGAGQALRGGLHSALAAGGSYRAGVRAGIRAGGDSCSRCARLRTHRRCGAVCGASCWHAAGAAGWTRSCVSSKSHRSCMHDHPMQDRRDSQFMHACCTF